MICFPNAKINIGLNIVSKRTDGYHNLETIFYPIPLKDILEFVPNQNSKTSISQSGINLNIPEDKNICMKAYNLLAVDYQLPPLAIYLHKIIPNGAGLGGGSADASFFLKSLNEYFNLHIPNQKLIDYASELGADCAFFINNKAVFASGTGNVFEDIELNLRNYYMVLVKPDCSISTPEAFKNIKVKILDVSLRELIKLPVSEWKNRIVNDFEESLFQKYPLLAEIKQNLYNQGAVYASMSGSGSAIYGLFTDKPDLKNQFNGMFYRQLML